MILNLQRKIKLDLAAIREFATALPQAVDEANSTPSSVAFVSVRRMKELNSTFRGKDSTTVVLSFPFEKEAFEPDTNNLGDIVISAEQAERQAAENGLTLEDEIKQLIL